MKSIFLYDLPDLTACNVFPPLHILNILLLRGWAGGSMSPKFTWKHERYIRTRISRDFAQSSHFRFVSDRRKTSLVPDYR
jgi:hypothetical protein